MFLNVFQCFSIFFNFFVQKEGKIIILELILLF